MSENRGAVGGADDPRVSLWASEAMPGETGFSAIAVGALSDAQTPEVQFSAGGIGAAHRHRRYHCDPCC
jgi:hypothetical protein